MRLLFPILLMAITVPLAAQSLPLPAQDNPRLQTIRYTAGKQVQLTLLPSTGLTVMLEPGEQIRRVSVDNDRMLDVRVSAERDSFIILPLSEQASGTLEVQSERRSYSFAVTTGSGLMAAYLVRFTYVDASPLQLAPPPEPTGEVWGYRLRGDRSVRPAQITDDGMRTYVSFAPDQALPAIFAVGPTGDEQVVDGYMREGRFVIDRVHGEIIFRIDRDKASAKRNREPEQDPADG